MQVLEKTHEATLAAIEVHWQAREVRFFIWTWIDDAAVQLEITGGGLTDLKVPCAKSPGTRDQINQMQAQELAGGVRLMIEMESGDVIEANVERFAVNHIRT